MTLAADRDLIARQYAIDFADVLDEGAPALRQRLADGRPLETAILGAFLDLLSRRPDSLIARKAGAERAAEVSRRAGDVLDAGWPDEPNARARLRELDAFLRGDGRRLNPGATADLTAAVLFAALRDGTIELPRPSGPLAWSGDRVPSST
jgi:triphosphoribosyl-dephospho-CoA synthase